MSAELTPTAQVAHDAAYTTTDRQRWQTARAEQRADASCRYVIRRLRREPNVAHSILHWNLLLAHRELAAAMGLVDEVEALAELRLVAPFGTGRVVRPELVEP